MQVQQWPALGALAGTKRSASSFGTSYVPSSRKRQAIQPLQSDLDDFSQLPEGCQTFSSPSAADAGQDYMPARRLSFPYQQLPAGDSLELLSAVAALNEQEESQTGHWPKQQQQQQQQRTDTNSHTHFLLPQQYGLDIEAGRGFSPPCNNPSCFEVGDAVDCTNTLEHQLCGEDGCVGELCFDQHCADVTRCDQACASETDCASPCFGNECEETEPCQDNCAVADATNYCVAAPKLVNGFYTSLPTPLYCGYDDAEALACGCVDPQCLSKDFCVHIQGHDPNPAQTHFHTTTAAAAAAAAAEFCGARSIKQAPLPHARKRSATKYRFAQPMYNNPHSGSSASSPPLADPGTPGLTSASSTTSFTIAASTTTSTTPSLSAAMPLLRPSVIDTDPLVCQWTDDNGSICGERCGSASELHTHCEETHVESLRREDTANNGFFCHWAGCERFGCRSFAAKPKLKRHLQTHTLHKPFECSVCGMKMKTKDAMEKHERTHSGSRPYVCTVDRCGKTFATSTELKTHMVVHSGAKPHLCAICGEAFADSSNLSKHKKTHFLGMWRCDACGTRMKRWDQMRRHVLTQGHMKEVVEDEAQQRSYKARMEKEWRMLPDEERLLSNSTTMATTAAAATG